MMTRFFFNFDQEFFFGKKAFCLKRNWLKGFCQQHNNFFFKFQASDTLEFPFNFNINTIQEPKSFLMIYEKYVK